MNGISGVWNLDGEPLDAAVLEAMSLRQRHRGADGSRRCVKGPVGFASQHTWVAPEDAGEHQPLVGSTAMLAIDGRVDNREELASALNLDRAASGARCVLAAYEKWGERFAEHVEGDFAAAVFDTREQRLLLARDVIGLRPLYYFSSPRVFAFASEIKALLAHPGIEREPDFEGVADFMLVGSRPLDRQDLTCFRGIYAVVPAHVVVVRGAGASPRRYWDFDTTRRIQLASYGDYVDAFREVLARAVRRRTLSHLPVAFSVSGGLDSSSLYCQAVAVSGAGNLDRSLHAISYVSDRVETDEQRYLSDIERTHGVTVERFPIEPHTGIARGVRDQVAAIEAPFVEHMWGVTAELHRRARTAGARVLISGQWGDQMLFSPAYLTDLLSRGAFGDIVRHTREYARYFGAGETRARRRALVIDAARHYLPAPLAPPVKWLRIQLANRRRRIKPWFSDDFLRPALRHRYRLATFDCRFHSAHARAVYLEARSKYQVQCMEWNAKVGAWHGLDAAFPLLDRDLIAFLMAIPGEMHARDGIPRSLLRDATCGVLPESIRTRTWKSDFTGFSNEGIAGDEAVIRDALGPDCLGVRMGFLDASRLRPALDRLGETARARDCVDAWDLGDIYGLEMWLRVFFQS